MKRKKVFIYIHQCILKGGVEKVFCNLLNNLPVEKYDITVLSHIAYLNNDLNAGLYPSNVRRRWLYYDEFADHGWMRLRQRLHNYIMPRFYPKWLKLQHFDTAIAAQEGMYATFIDQNLRAKNKLLWIHNDMRLCHWTRREFGSSEAECACYRRFSKVVCVSKSVAESMEAVFGRMDNLCVCYNPIDTNEIERKISEFQVERDTVPLFVAIGRLAEQKGFDRLLRICRRLNKDGYNYQVLILGEGEKRGDLEAELAKGGLENVRLLGNQPNPFPYMKAADWLICTSRHEGFNMVLHEAIWCGTPIVTTDNAGTRELLGANTYGIVTPNEEDAFYEAMCRILQDGSLLQHYRTMVSKRQNFIDLPGRIDAIEKIL